jgi:PKD repeat protein
MMLTILMIFPIWINAQHVIADFELTSRCRNYTELKNNSSVSGSAQIIGYLWEVSGSSGVMYRSTEVNPAFSFDKAGEYNFKLIVTKDDFEEITIEKSEIIYDIPTLEIVEWNELVCSNAEHSYYVLEEKPGFSYQWDYSDIPSKYIAVIKGENTHELNIQWRELEDFEVLKQFTLTCRINAPESDGSCQNEISAPVVLLSASVPVSENLQVVSKPNDNSILFCIIDEPERFLFEWGYEQDNEVATFGLSENNYFQFADGLLSSRQYFVEVFNRDFRYCSRKVLYTGQKLSENLEKINSQKVEIVQVFPNPTAELVNIEFLKNSAYSEEIGISIINIMGIIEDTYLYTLTEKASIISLPVNHYKKGNYFIRIDIRDEKPLIQRIVVFKP